MFDSLLIANRGEIVGRIARTAKRLGLRTIAIASDADHDSVHARACDELVVIGGERPADSYLHIEKVIDAAKRSGARGDPSGLRFLAESGPLRAGRHRSGPRVDRATAVPRWSDG